MKAYYALDWRDGALRLATLSKADGAWQEHENFAVGAPAFRQKPVVQILDEKLFVYGGSRTASGTEFVASGGIFDPSTSKWNLFEGQAVPRIIDWGEVHAVAAGTRLFYFAERVDNGARPAGRAVFDSSNLSWSLSETTGHEACSRLAFGGLSAFCAGVVGVPSATFHDLATGTATHYANDSLEPLLAKAATSGEIVPVWAAATGEYVAIARQVNGAMAQHVLGYFNTSSKVWQLGGLPRELETTHSAPLVALPVGERVVFVGEGWNVALDPRSGCFAPIVLPQLPATAERPSPVVLGEQLAYVVLGDFERVKTIFTLLP